MSFITIAASTCPLLLCAIGALFSEYAGVLALFIEGVMCLGGFMTYALTLSCHSAILGASISCLISVLIIFVFSLLVEKFNAHRFISGLAINMILGALTTFLSSRIFGTQGVLSSNEFAFSLSSARIYTLIVTLALFVAAVLFLLKTKPGLYIRISGSDSDLLASKGISAGFYRVFSWCLSAFFASVAGSLLVFRISSYVPNISSGRGWMALAAVYLGKRKTWKIALAVLIFCGADIFASNIQNFLPQIPSSILLSLPYIIMILLIFADKK